MDITKKLLETPAQEAHTAWCEATSLIRNPYYALDILRGSIQVLAILDKMLKAEDVTFTPGSMRHLWNEVKSCRKNLNLTVVVDELRYSWKYRFQEGPYTLSALVLGRKIALICLRLLAEQHAVNDQFRLKDYRVQLEEDINYWINLIISRTGHTRDSLIQYCYFSTVAE